MSFKKIKPSKEQLEAIKSGVQIYAPICLYLILREIESYKNNQVGITPEERDEIKKIYGIPLGQWPIRQKEDWRRLSDSLPLEQTKKIFAEINYFLIYSVGALSSNYVNTDDQSPMLDFLKSIFNDRTLWNPEDPTEDCFSKYRDSDNTFKTLLYSLSDAIGEHDPLMSHALTIEIAMIPKFFLEPAVSQIFEKVP